MKNSSNVFKEAKRLYDLGFSIIWLHKKSKRPVEGGWTSGPRKPWSYLKETYIDGYNVGVRLGESSKIGEDYLACIDVDIKDPEYKTAALTALKKLIGTTQCPEVRTGSGNTSRHLYCVSKKPFKMITFEKSEETYKDEKGVKHHKWEICIYSTGRQMALPPSIHPDTGKTYAWFKPFDDEHPLPGFNFQDFESEPTKSKDKKSVDVSSIDSIDFQVSRVDIEWLPISDQVRDAILTGEGVTDRSGYLMKASSALLNAGLSQNEVLSVLTDPKTYLGKCGYDHAKTNNRKVAANWVYKYTLKKVEGERSNESVFANAPVATRKLTKEEIEAQSEELSEERHWTQNIERTGPKGDGPPKGSVKNVVLILENEVSESVFARDEFALRDIYTVKTPWGGKKNALLTDDDTIQIKFWLSQRYGFEPKSQVIEEASAVIAKNNLFNPVKDYLNSLPEWDKEKRLDSWLSENFEAEGNPEYLAQVFRKWMVAMVLRVFKPGAKFDWMPIFEGYQGGGKSSFGRLLVGDKYFLDSLPALTDKDAALALQGIWGVEMGELSHFRRNELEVIKSFMTRTIDKVRPPFGRRTIESARHCVFFGTTNKETYLRDDTGNRRFKPVKVGGLNFKALRNDRDQLFAEAKYLLDQKIETERTLHLTGEALIFEATIHKEKMVEDESDLIVEIIKDFIEKSDENNFDFSRFKMHDLFEGTGPLAKWKFDNRNAQFASKALKKLGGKSWKSHGRKMWKIEKTDKKQLLGIGFKETYPRLDFM